MSDIDTAAIREAFEGNRNRSLRLSDEILTSVIKRAGKTWDEFTDNDDEEGACSFLEKAEDAAQAVSVTDLGISVLVKKIDDQFEAEITECIDAVVKGKTTAVDIYAQMKRVYSREEMNSMPIPGTEQGHVTGNQKPDKVKTQDVSGKPITVVWTNDFVAATARGKEFDSQLDDIAKEIKSVNSIPRLRGKSTQDLAALRAEATQKRNALRSMFKRAIALHHQWEAVSGLPEVVIEWIGGEKSSCVMVPKEYGRDRTGEANSIAVSKSPKPIWIYPKGAASKGRDFSVTQFLAFDAAAALANGGTMVALTDTVKKGSDDQSDDDNGDGEDMPEDVAMATFSQLVNYLNKRENMANVLRIMTDKKHPEHNDWLENMGDLYSLIYPMMRKTRSQYEALKETKLEGFETKAA